MSDERSLDLSESRSFLALGSNVGDRELNVLRAAWAVERLGIGCRVRLSSLYETSPVACPPMGNFINAVVELQPLLCVGDLLKRLQMLERSMGRTGGHNEPREIDIDILIVGRQQIATDVLTVPHPRYRERAFVLIPLLELAPDFRCPVTGCPARDDLDALPTHQEVSRISSRRVGAFHGVAQD